MNFLGHLYLSGENDGFKIGNFIGDYVKGKAYLEYDGDIRQGILLHRKIDRFTDLHDMIKGSSIWFRPGYGRYSGVVVDIVFDHLLASNWHKYSKYRLRDFARKTHALLLANFGKLPLRVKRFLPYMIQNRRLESYAARDGIRKALELMSQYTSLPGEHDFAMDMVNKHYEELLGNFERFMDDIILYVASSYQVRIRKPEIVQGNFINEAFKNPTP